MNCVEFNKNIKPFINNQLDIDTLEEFLIHLNKCKECHEELEILYLVEKTLVDTDDENTSYDFDSMLKKSIAESEEKVYITMRNRFINKALYISSAAVSIFTGIFFFAGFVL